MARRKVNEGMTDNVELGLQFTPMIDCIFQLIIFFMVNIHFRTEEGLLKAFLPRASNAPAEPTDTQEDKIFITVAEDPPGVLLLAVNKRRVGGTTEQAKYDDLEKMLRGMRQAYQEMGKKTPPVIIDAQARLPYKYVISALNVCGKLDLENVMFQFPQE
jgi:biopolymer transport protein ExbD